MLYHGRKPLVNKIGRACNVLHIVCNVLHNFTIIAVLLDSFVHFAIKCLDTRPYSPRFLIFAAALIKIGAAGAICPDNGHFAKFLQAFA